MIFTMPGNEGGLEAVPCENSAEEKNNKRRQASEEMLYLFGQQVDKGLHPYMLVLLQDPSRSNKSQENQEVLHSISVPIKLNWITAKN